MFYELKRKIRVFISSKIDKKYTPIRRQLQYLLLETGLYDDPFAFEEEYASSIKTIDFYLAGLDDANVAVFLIDNKDGVSAGVREEYQFAKRKDNLRKIYIFCKERSKRKTDIQEELEQKLGEKYATCSNFYEMAELAYISLIQDLVNVYAMPKKPPTQSRNSGDNDNGSGGDGGTNPSFTIPSSDSKDRSIDDPDTSCTVDTSSTSGMSTTSDLNTHVFVGSEVPSASTGADRAAKQAATYFIDKNRISSARLVEDELVDYLLSLIDFGVQSSSLQEEGRQAEGQEGSVELSFLKTVLYKDTFSKASFDTLRNSIISSSDERLHPFLNSRFDVLEAVYNGEGRQDRQTGETGDNGTCVYNYTDIDKALEYTRRALTIALENPFIPQWLVLDVAVDIRNLAMLKSINASRDNNSGSTISSVYYGDDEDYQLGQGTINTSKQSVFYPIIDRLQENLYQEIAATYEKEHLKSPYITVFRTNRDIMSVFQYIAKTFLIALMHGSLTQIAMIKDRLISVLTMYINLYSNRAPVVERIRLHFVSVQEAVGAIGGSEKKEKLDDVIRTYHAEADVLTPEEAKEIIGSIKRIRPVVIQTATSNVQDAGKATVNTVDAERTADTVVNSVADTATDDVNYSADGTGNTQGENALGNDKNSESRDCCNNNSVRDKQLFYFLSKFGYYCDDNDFSDLFLTLHEKVLKWIDERRNFDIVYDYVFDFYRGTLGRTRKRTSSQKAAEKTVTTACKEAASTCEKDVSCQKCALDFCFKLMDVMGDNRSIPYVESLCKLLSEFDVTQLSESDLKKIIDFVTYDLNDNNIGQIRNMNVLLVHLMEGQEQQDQQPRQAQREGQAQLHEQKQEEQPQAESSNIYLANILRSKLPRFFIAMNTPTGNIGNDGNAYIEECIRGVSACNALAEKGTYGLKAGYITELKRIVFSSKFLNRPNQQPDQVTQEQLLKKIVDVAIETLACQTQQIWCKIYACEILMALSGKMDSLHLPPSFSQQIFENLWSNRFEYSNVSNYSSFGFDKDQPFQLHVAYELLLIKYAYTHSVQSGNEHLRTSESVSEAKSVPISEPASLSAFISSLFQMLFSIPMRQKYVIIKSLEYLSVFLQLDRYRELDKHRWDSSDKEATLILNSLYNYVISCSNNNEEKDIKLLVINLLLELSLYTETRRTALMRLALFMGEGSADAKLAVMKGLERVVIDDPYITRIKSIDDDQDSKNQNNKEDDGQYSSQNADLLDTEHDSDIDSDMRVKTAREAKNEADYYLQSILSQAQLCRHYVVRKLAKEIEDKYHIINRVLDIRFNNGIVSVFSEDGFLLDKARILSIQAEYGQDREDNLIGILRLTELNIEYEKKAGGLASDFSADFAYETEVENKLWNDLFDKEYNSIDAGDVGTAATTEAATTDVGTAVTEDDADDNHDEPNYDKETRQSAQCPQSGLRWQDKAINKARSDIARYTGVKEEAINVVEE